MTGRPIFLTGFMATGKSKIGKLMARRLRRQFVDTDELIQDRQGRTIAEIFDTEGEEVFRQLEYECVVEVSRRERIVIALGGGAITQERNREAVRAAGGVLVCLEADLDTILERVSRKETRPLLSGLNEEERRDKIGRMLAERAPHYATADIAIRSTEDSTPESTATELLEEIERWEKCEPSS